MSNVVKLASSREHPQTRACSTCRHARNIGDPFYQKCVAFGLYTSTARLYEWYCGHDGNFWEPRPPEPPGLWQRLLDRFLPVEKQ